MSCHRFWKSANRTVLVMIAVAIVFAVPAIAQKPGGGSTGGGTIYFATGGKSYQMNSDGSGKTVLAAMPDGEPSRQLHAGHRWFLRLGGVVGAYPDDGQRYEIFAYRDDGVSFQLTNDPDLEPLASIRWQPGDGAIAWIAQRWDPLNGEVVAAGIYEAALAYDEVGDLIGLMDDTGVLLLSESDIGSYDWSPDGTRLVYDTPSTRDLWIADLATGTVNLLYDGPAYRAAWSPDDTKIAFQEAVYRGGILTVKLDGTGLKRIARPSGMTKQIYSPSWSPTGSHLIYHEWDHEGYDSTWQYIYRARADGSGKTNLTPEFDYSTAAGWR